MGMAPEARPGLCLREKPPGAVRSVEEGRDVVVVGLSAN